jgi:choline-glycine betaine transporter
MLIKFSLSRVNAVVWQGLMVPVHAFPRPLRSLESFTGRIGNYIEHFIWFAIGLHGEGPRTDSHIVFIQESTIFV